MVDSYRGDTKDYSFIEYAAFVSFFPQLVAGPIVLHKELIPQFRDEKRRSFDYNFFAPGLWYFTVGLFKKVLIADSLGNYVNVGFGAIDQLTSIDALIVIFSYSLQIYFDFSGYSDMAIGLGKMFHLDLPKNFNSPYKAVSINDFWKRWHITLTRFLRQYIYFPLGGSRKSKARTYLNVMIVFLVSGIWHGANWTFIIWGLLHGILSVFERIIRKERLKVIPKAVRMITTFIVVSFLWLIFRAESMGEVIDLLRRIRCGGFKVSPIVKSASPFEIDKIILHISILNNHALFSYGLFIISFILILTVVCMKSKNLHEVCFEASIGRALVTTILLFWCIISFAGVSTFIYFNF